MYVAEVRANATEEMGDIQSHDDLRPGAACDSDLSRVSASALARKSERSRCLSSEGVSTLVSRNDYIKALHGALLQKVGIEATRIFWARHPLLRNGVFLTPTELAEHI